MRIPPVRARLTPEGKQAAEDIVKAYAEGSTIEEIAASLQDKYPRVTPKHIQLLIALDSMIGTL